MELKRFLDSNQVDYEVKNINEDKEARKTLVTELKSRSVPTSVVGEEVVIGFKQAKITELLELEQ